jgi:spore maturation protein CgeB
MNKLYRGVRQGQVAKVFVDNEELSLEPSKILHPSDATHEWAYFGSGPSQTALAILYDATEDSENSLKYYQEFKFDFIANASYEGFTILQSQAQEWLALKIKAENGPSAWGWGGSEGEI